MPRLTERMRCSNCVSFDPYKSECRFHAANANSQGKKEFPYPFVVSLVKILPLSFVWPMVLPDDWCNFFDAAEDYKEEKEEMPVLELLSRNT